MLQEYLQGAREGVIDPEKLDELIATLEEMQGYHHAGKLKLPGERALIEISESIAGYTADIARNRGAQPSRPSGTPAADLFGQIREQRIRQRAWGKMNKPGLRRTWHCILIKMRLPLLRQPHVSVRFRHAPQCRYPRPGRRG